MLDIEQYQKIYSMLDGVTPVSFDCGSLCGSICCSDEAFRGCESYIYLLPGEKEFLEAAGSDIPFERVKRSKHYLPVSWGRYIYVARCPGKEHCNRALRPIQCRTFPLQPYIGKSGELEMVSCYSDVPYVCPLIAGNETLSDDFVRVTREAWLILISEKAVRDLVKLDSKDRYL